MMIVERMMLKYEAMITLIPALAKIMGVKIKMYDIYKGYNAM